jgi:enoyl-CoA hydratase/carnithine racemase
VPSEFETIVVTHQENGVSLLELNNPDHLNPLDPLSTEGEITQALHELEHEPTVRVVVITGRGRAFSAGAYLREKPKPATDYDAKATMPQRLAYDYSYGLMWKALLAFKKPLIAAVNGYCLGGGWELAHMCDLIVANESAVFGAVEIELGVNPFATTTNYLPKMIGKHRAMDLILNGRKINAQEALDLGLVNKVVPDDELITAAFEMADELAARPPLTMALTRRLVHRAMAVDEDYELERAYAYLLRSTDDTKAAWASVAERKPTPAYEGR